MSGDSAVRSTATPSKNEAFERIETLEQDLIQHIRTAGIRKARETDIIEEVMTIRRERRQLFGGLKSDVQYLEEAALVLKSKLARLLASQESAIAAKHVELIEQLKQKDIQIAAANEKSDSEIRQVKERYKTAARSEIDKISQKYEDKLRLLDARMQDLSLVSTEKVDERAKNIAKEMVSAVELKLRESSALKLTKYKETLRTLVEKERQLEDSINRQKALTQDLDQEKRLLLERLQRAENSLLVTSGRERELSSQVSLLKQTLQEARSHAVILQAEVQGTKEKSSTALTQAQAEHQTELDNVDNKVRRALQSRDDTIQQLKTQLVAAENSRKEAEKMLAELNAGIAAVVVAKPRQPR